MISCYFFLEMCQESFHAHCRMIWTISDTHTYLHIRIELEAHGLFWTTISNVAYIRWCKKGPSPTNIATLWKQQIIYKLLGTVNPTRYKTKWYTKCHHNIRAQYRYSVPIPIRWAHDISNAITITGRRIGILLKFNY